MCMSAHVQPAGSACSRTATGLVSSCRISCCSSQLWQGQAALTLAALTKGGNPLSPGESHVLSHAPPRVAVMPAAGPDTGRRLLSAIQRRVRALRSGPAALPHCCLQLQKSRRPLSQVIVHHQRTKAEAQSPTVPQRRSQLQRRRPRLIL